MNQFYLYKIYQIFRSFSREYKNYKVIIYIKEYSDIKDLELRKYNFDVFKDRSLIKINRYKRDKRLFYVFE